MMAKIDEMNHRKGGKMKKDWTWYTGVLEYYTCSSILYILHVRAILGKKAAQLPTRASEGAKNTKLDLGLLPSSNSQYQIPCMCAIMWVH